VSVRAILCALGLAFACAGHAGADAPLPVVEAPARGAGDTFVVLYSGDGGWAGIDRALAADLARRGLPVAGVDALSYFATRRTPEAAAADLARLVERYGQAWSRPKVVLAGYSFGADALPLIVPRLAPAVRARVRLVVLISPDETGRLAFHPGDWLGLKAADDVPLGPALAAMRATPSLCIAAAGDAHDACTRFKGEVDRVSALPGGHHFQGDYRAVADLIAAGAGAGG
jgi:type IV secretory pathway VirJ component